MAIMKVIVLLAAAFIAVNASEEKKDPNSVSYSYSSGPIVSHQVVSGGHYVVSGSSSHVVSGGSTVHKVIGGGSVHHQVVHKPHVVHRPAPRPVLKPAPRPIAHGGCYVEFFQHSNYHGTRDVYRGSAGSLRHNDAMSSLKVPRGCCATIYEHGNFGGRHQQYCSKVVPFIGNKWNDKISSVRVSGNILLGGSGACRAELFQHSNYGGRKDTYTGSVVQVRHNDDMSSLKVGGGCCVVIYEHSHYRGRQQKYCRSTKFVGGWWNDKTSSVKVVRGDEPEEEDVAAEVEKEEA